jgi:hypothetical protein
MGRSGVRILVGVLVGALVLAAVTLTVPPQAIAAGAWVKVAVPSPGAQSNELTSVSCVSEHECTAVGWYVPLDGIARNLIIRTTDGATWTRMASPQPEANRLLESVSCSSATTCTAVGYALRPAFQTPIQVTVVLRTTDGVHWVQVPTPNPSGRENGLYGVSCVSAVRCTAVGWYSGTNRFESLIIRTINGTDWYTQAAPSPALGGNLWAVDCVSSTTCTAVGNYSGSPTRRHSFVLRTVKGGPWTRVPSPNPYPRDANTSLAGVSCPGPSTCTAAGAFGPVNTGFMNPRAFILQTTNGTTWTRAPTAATSDITSMTDVSCRSATNCTAVGHQLSTLTGMQHSTVMRTTDGVTWKFADPSTSGDAQWFEGISCPRVNRCVAVGRKQIDNFSGTRHLNFVMKET